ncbi:MAG: signal peptidase I [Candidatus Verstraetearchaeota archaeon]|nr:signal peptidase I [Candidatus Verstraetearchaeota archaeon]
MAANHRATGLALLIFFAVFMGAVYSIRMVSGTNLPVAAVQSGSMEPNIPTGSLIFVQAVDPEKIVAGGSPVGDVVIYVQNGTVVRDYFLFASYDPLPISHRVINKTLINGTYYFLTKGDANIYPDQNPWDPESWVPEDRILGKVTFSIPYLGYPFLWFKNLWLMSIALIIIIVLILLPPGEKNSNAEIEPSVQK